MTFKEAMDYIEGISVKGSVMGLDSISQLLNRLGNPQDNLKFIHIAGTNGKGSVLAYISNILTCAGYKTGRYVSPIIDEYCEKIQIDGVYISYDCVANLMERVKQACEAMVKEGFNHPTAFEIETAMAFLYFLDKECDIVVLETGMGGSEDATNVITNTLVSIITSISLDHVGIIGKDLNEIARCKAGIIKKDSKVICYKQSEDIVDIIRDKAKEMNADFVLTNPKLVVQREDSFEGQLFDYGNLKDIRISLLGLHQLKNVICAIEAVFALRQKGYNISDEAIREGARLTRWKARFDVISRRPLIIADGAHNPDGAKTLVEAVDRYLDGYIKIFVIGVLKDKDYKEIIRLTNPLANAIITINPDNSRGLTDVLLKESVDNITDNSIPVIAAGRIESGIELANQIVMQLNEPKCAIIVCGSLSFMGDLYRYIGEV